MATSLENLRLELARQTNSLLATGTADGATVEHIRDSVINSRYRDPMELVGAYALITSGDRDGDKRIVDLYGPDEGALYVDQDFSATPGTATYEIHKYDPALLDLCINYALTHRWYPYPVLLTMVTDGDMETSGVSNWTDSSSTSTKSTTAANIWRGAQSLRVANSGAGGYTRTASVNVLTGTSYMASAFVRCDAGTADLVVYDATNSASIDHETSAERDWVLILFTFTTPPTCKQLQIRLTGTESTADCFWDDLVLAPQSGRRFWPDSTVTERFQIRNVKGWRGGDTISGRSYEARGVQEFEWGNADTEYDPTSAHPVSVALRRPHGGHYPLWADTKRSYAELTTDAATTAANPDWVVAWAAVELYNRLKAGTVDRATKAEYEQERGDWMARAIAYDRGYQYADRRQKLRLF